MSLYFAPFLRHSEILVENCGFYTTPTSIWRPVEVTRWNFAEMFGVIKLESVGYRTTLFA